jgi:hypothetical protein
MLALTVGLERLDTGFWLNKGIAGLSGMTGRKGCLEDVGVVCDAAEVEVGRMADEGVVGLVESTSEGGCEFVGVADS